MRLLLYTDPGSGMLLLQIILAFGASAVFFFRKTFYRLLGKRSPIHDFEGGQRPVEEDGREVR